MGSILVHQPTTGRKFEAGDVLYLGKQNGHSYNQVYRNAFYVSPEPLFTNGNQDITMLHGWLGNFNDVTNSAEGKARVSDPGSGRGCDCSSPECYGGAMWVTRVSDSREIHYAGMDEED